MSQKFEDFVSPLKVTELKDELKKRGLSPYGNKAALQQRLKECLQAEEDGTTADTTAESESEQQDQSGFNLTLSDNPAEEEENTDESAMEAEQNETTEQTVEQSDNVDESTASATEAADSTTEEKKVQESTDVTGDEEVDGGDADNKDEEKSADLANGDDEADETDKADETDEAKPGKSDSSASRKRPRQDEEDQKKETPKKQSFKDTHYEIIDEYMAEDDYQPPDDDSVIVLDRYHSDLYFNIQKDGLGGYGRTEKGFAYLWAGCRATWGCKDGRYCYECKIGEYMDVDLPSSEEHPHVVRVGFSTENSSMNLGEVSQSYGYGASGQSSTAGMFNSYGESFGPGDVIGCFVDLHSEEQNIAFSKNGKHFGKCFVLSPDFRGKVLFPHITTKNVRVTVNFGNEPLMYEIPDDYQPLQKGDSEHLVRASKGPTKKEDCEVIMMVGLPAAGKSKWAEKHCQENPEMNINILGTNFIMDKMKVTGLQRKRNYHGRWEQLIKQATQILNRLFILASRQPRNYIIDQTNVYKNAQARKIRHFEGFKCKAVVICPTEEERKKRDSNRQREEGIFIPDEAVYEMKVNFSLPTAGELFEEVLYIEQSEEETKAQVEKYRTEKKPASSSHSKRPKYDHSSGSSRSSHDSRPPPRSGPPRASLFPPPRGASSYPPRGGPSRGGPPYHQPHGSAPPFQSQGAPPYRGSGSGGYRDSYGYRDNPPPLPPPPPPQGRDFGHYNHPPMRPAPGGYGPPHPRGGMDSGPSHYDRYGPPPPQHRYDRGPPPPPGPPHGYPPPHGGGGSSGGYYGGGGGGGYRGDGGYRSGPPPPPPSAYYSQRRY